MGSGHTIDADTVALWRFNTVTTAGLVGSAADDSGNGWTLSQGDSSNRTTRSRRSTIPMVAPARISCSSSPRMTSPLPRLTDSSTIFVCQALPETRSTTATRQEPKPVVAVKPLLRAQIQHS